MPNHDHIRRAHIKAAHKRMTEQIHASQQDNSAPKEKPISPTLLRIQANAAKFQPGGERYQGPPISQPADDQEKEADAIAGKVANGEGEKKGESESEGKGESAALNSSSAPAVQRKEEDAKLVAGSEDGTLQGSHELQKKLDATKGSGQALDDKTRGEMSTKLGADLSDVRIHTDSEASEMAEGINAKAFTYGQDIYFKDGSYNTESREGKELLVHELVHTVQQKEGVQRMVQRKGFEPEDAVVEMIGRKFEINTQLTIANGSIKLTEGSIVTITRWENAEREVTATITKDKKTHSIKIDKAYLKPVGASSAGLAQYSAGVEDQTKTVNSGKKEVEAWKTKKAEYEKHKTMHIYNAELERLENRQTDRYAELNQRLIQETMFNVFDTSIKKWVDHYNVQYKPKELLDPNIVKSIIYEETKMGTRGEHLAKPPYSWSDPVHHPVRSRYNVGQSIDSWGQQQFIMIKEMAPAIYTKYGLQTLEKEAIWKGMSNEDYVAWNGGLFMNAMQEFSSTKNPSGNNLMGDDKNDLYYDYDFWIRTSVRWLFEKYNTLSFKERNWPTAVKRYNGNKSQAAAYRDRVMSRIKNK